MGIYLSTKKYII